jgi:signal transduction histidine kinase/CheY-like chemotaxis protein
MISSRLSAADLERENFRKLFAQVPEVVCILSGPEHIFEFVNQAHVRLLGFDATGMNVRQAQPESPTVHALLDGVYNSGDTAHLYEIPLVVGKHLRYFNLTYAPRFDDRGGIDGIMVLGTEVTSDVHRNKALSLQRDALSLALSDAPLQDVLNVLAEMVERQVGDHYYASIMLADAEGKNLVLGSAKTLPPLYANAISKVQIGENSGSCGLAAYSRVPVLVEDIEKDPHWVSYREVALENGLRSCWSLPILSSQGRVLGAFALYSRDKRLPAEVELQIVEIAKQTTALILERKSEFDKRVASRAALEESESRLALALDAGNLGLWDWNAKTGYVYLSDTLMREWEIDPESFKNTLPECLERIHEQDREQVWNEIQRAIEQDRPYDVDYRVRRRNGEIVWINALGRCFVDAEKKPDRLTGITLNITERRRVAQELQLAKEEAERANHLKSAFLANMSHEIRTPLGAMMGFAELLGDPAATASEKSNYIDIMLKNGEQLGHVINDILDLSKVETGHISFEYLKVRPLQVAHEVVSLMSVLAKEKGLALSFEADDSTPDELATDPTRMKQVLMNLVSNALKFTKVGSIKIKLSGFEGKSGEKCCAFDVTDTGVGIAEESVDNLFKVFSQADNSMTRRYGGTGLGLALSRSLARAMGGNVRLVKTQLDLGSTFHFSVESRDELLPKSVSPREGIEATRSVELAPDVLKGVRVLVIEDSADNQQLIWRYLSKYGARIDLADNGSEGMIKALASEHDVVLCDLQMPVMDGYTAVGKLRARGYRTPIIALTAHAMSDVQKKCKDVGCNDHLPKPINSRELVETVKRYAGR